MNLLLDTNVLIDYLGKKAPFYDDALRIIAAGYFGDAKLWVPAQSFKDAFFVLSHYVNSANIQAAFREVLEVVEPVPLTAEDISIAAQLEWDDFEDCLVAISASKIGAQRLITRDKKGFSRSMVPPQSPHEWLETMRSGHRLHYDSVKL